MEDVGRRPQAWQGSSFSTGRGWSERRSEGTEFEHRKVRVAGLTGAVVCTFAPALHPTLHPGEPQDAAGSAIGPIFFETSGMFAPLRVSQTPEVGSPAPADMLSVPGNGCK